MAITECAIAGMVKTLIPEKNWEKICLLILYLVPRFASIHFIYEKLHKWDALTFNEKSRTTFLLTIGGTLENMCTEGLIREKTLKELGLVKFKKFCDKEVVGLVSHCAKYPTRSVYHISEEGRRRARIITGSQSAPKYSQEKVASIAGR